MTSYSLKRGPLILSTLLIATNMAMGQKRSRLVLKSGPAKSQSAAVTPSPKFSCLPKGIIATDVVSYGLKGAQQVTVEKRLLELKARCRGSKLVDAKGREVRFFRLSCWGNPPPDYLEIQQRESKELSELKRRYTVIVFSCNPMVQ